MFSSTTETIAAQKRAHRAQAFASAPAFVEAEHGQYIRATANEIVNNIESGKWTASQVLEAYIARAALAHATTNCGTEVLFEEARAQAKVLDVEFAETKKLKGPLHGVPVSFKDQFDIAGFDSTIGFTQWANKPATEEARLVALLRAAGAIPFIKTNVPQTMLAFECRNPLWGQSTNPWNERYTCGGSSGGEGALLAMDGSAIGIGSDVGGSLRIPASYCGVYSIKPSVGRICSDGARAPCPAFEGVKTVVGPMSRSVADLELVCKVTFGVPGLYPDTAPVPYRDVVLPSKLRFGYYTSDKFIKASPANKRAVLETVEALRKQGHECVQFEIPDGSAMQIFVALSSADGYKKLLSHLGPDPRDSSLFLVTLGPRLPGFLRNLLAWGAETFAHDPIFASSARASRVKSVFDYHECLAQRNEFQRIFYREVWAKHGFDGIICPVQAMPVIGHGDSTMLSPLAVATILYNIVDHPAGVVPVTRVDPSKDTLTDEWVNGPGLGSPIYEKQLYRGDRPTYDPVRMKGIPVGVQVVGRKWEDEKVLGMMKVVDEALGPRGFGPGMWKQEKE